MKISKGKLGKIDKILKEKFRITKAVLRKKNKIGGLNFPISNFTKTPPSSRHVALHKDSTEPRGWGWGWEYNAVTEWG